MLKIGDWVTQYSSGYWKVLNILPKYADSDYSYNGNMWQKGDRLGDWVILKKGFTPKLRPSNACECVDAQWCKAVTTDTLEAIKAAFRENPKARQKFDLSPDMPTPAIASTWLRLTEAQAAALKELLASLPERFTKERFWAQAVAFQKSIADPSAGTHILYIYGYPWEMDAVFEPLFFDAELKEIP